MNKLIIAFALIFGSVCMADVPKVNLSKMTLEERQQFILKRLGGYVAKPNTAQGQIVIVNAQNKVRAELIAEAINNVNEKLHYRISYTNGEFSLPSPKIEGEATLYVIDDASMPTLLSAPENRWAMVNLTRLSSGIGDKKKILESRVKKELTRGFCLLCGTQDSNYKESLLGCKTKPEDLDKHLDCRLPIDIPKRFGPYLAEYGIEPEVVLPYRQACMEGWAPQPTNEIQRTVWNEVHAIPDKPITIEYDPTKDK